MCLENGILDEKTIKSIEKECKQTVDQAIVDAQNDPEPPIAELWTDIVDDSVESCKHFLLWLIDLTPCAL